MPWIEKLQMQVAWKMPRWLVYWCAIRLLTSATTGKHASTVTPELTALEALDRWVADGRDKAAQAAQQEK